jgi:hypothetical protein
MRGNFHVRFGIGGGKSDFVADHTKEKREMKNPHQIEMKNGKPAMQGECSVCGTKLTRILSAKAK